MPTSAPPNPGIQLTALRAAADTDVRHTMRTAGICATLLLVALIAACARAVDDGGLRVEGAGPSVGQDGHTTEAIGLETVAGVVPLLAAGCVLPCSTTETFTTSADAQTQIIVRLYRGAVGPAVGGEGHWGISDRRLRVWPTRRAGDRVNRHRNWTRPCAHSSRRPFKGRLSNHVRARGLNRERSGTAREARGVGMLA